MHSSYQIKIKRICLQCGVLILMLIGSSDSSIAQTCDFPTAAQLYKVDEGEAITVYRPKVDGSEVNYQVNGDKYSPKDKLKAKKVQLIIDDRDNGAFLFFHSGKSRCSEGSQLLERPEDEYIIALTKERELIKGFGVYNPLHDNIKIFKEGHESGAHYETVQSPDDLVLLVFYGPKGRLTKFFVTGQELAKYSAQLYDLLAPATATTEIEIIEPIAQVYESSSAVEKIEESNATDTTPSVQEVVGEYEPNTNAQDNVTINNISKRNPDPVNVEDNNEEAQLVTPHESINENAPSPETENKPDIINTSSDDPFAEFLAPIEEAPKVVRMKSRPVLSDIEKEEVRIKGKEKVETLGGCFEIISSKSSANAFKDDNYNLAISLFIHDSVLVQVSSLNSENTKPYIITSYLKRMRQLHYTDVEITFHNVSKVSNLRLNTDGTYTGIITFSQTFRGTVDGKPVYADRTDKNVEIIIRPREVFAGSREASIEWDVFLGNIYVDQTSAF